MEIRFAKLGWRFYLQIRRVQKVQGVNSEYQPGYHFLMWDFDNADLDTVRASLVAVQFQCNLPSISIVKTPNGYHAYCFKSCTFQEARMILCLTPDIDEKYLGTGLLRGYWTLRFTGSEFRHATTLPSDVPDDLTYSEVANFVEYTRGK